MNLKARYEMLRAAVLNMVGVSDDVETLKAMAKQLRPAAAIDDNAKASLLVLETLVVTHQSEKGNEQRG